jgi:hypothetical protein
MTDRQLIAEFILLNIKPNNIVEIKLSDSDQILRGYILDKDVFRSDWTDAKLEMKNKLYPHLKIKLPKRITFQLLKESTNI